MAGYRGHLSLSTPCGVAVGVLGVTYFGVQPTVGILGGVMCTLSGMLPDLDSDSGVPMRETFCLLGAMVPMLLLRRLTQSSLSEDQLLLVMIGLYAGVRFGLQSIFKHFTVHRGMFHSIPAMLIAGGVAFESYGSEHYSDRLYLACAVMIGFFSHLLLDEIYSVKVSFGGVKFNQFAGTAIKFFSPSLRANLACYGLLIVVLGSVEVDLRQDTGYSLVDVVKNPRILKTEQEIHAPQMFSPQGDTPPGFFPNLHKPVPKSQSPETPTIQPSPKGQGPKPKEVPSPNPNGNSWVDLKLPPLPVIGGQGNPQPAPTSPSAVPTGTPVAKPRGGNSSPNGITLGRPETAPQSTTESESPFRLLPRQR
ncbi:metal-dependent hydrolase [Tuwongella immobilis]|uniref:Membrane-bound metal-dependent hydrolase n=1 Tax=Tuwongella immobilis TaxID=692036 RepID=A0A6C2YJU5_9BACT|nr:metal-dependent hydrolase [Tuwongella immobilis]VIP01222.1 Membrane-bound metal-dependent hydrolase OS=Rhodopirellula europaea SH398 GN=RESH_01748 PE=4 SV=1: DUF457 [Tuwongella immobilis]VTR97870.1 Membrane-bound metal-dependent hydrolase OS=Rhodopirellula europaea SH398 GN=RESH_01748 PE=4 SV=1: DUF457 [Tuwongella immobilis]